MPDEIALGVESLERRHRQARERLENLLGALTVDASEAVNSDPKGPENRPHYLPTNQVQDQNDTVAAIEEGSRTDNEAVAPPPASPRQETPKSGRVLKLHPDDLVRLAPRLKLYLLQPNPTWPEIIDAAAFLRSDLDVSKSLWARPAWRWAASRRRSRLPSSRPRTRRISGRRRVGISTAWWQRPRPASSISTAPYGPCVVLMSRNRAGRLASQIRDDRPSGAGTDHAPPPRTLPADAVSRLA